MSRARTTLIVFGTLAMVCVLPSAVLIVGVRSGNRRFIRAFTSFQRDVLNPRAVAAARKPGSQWTIVEHVGRRTGDSYETPVGAVRDGDGWVIPLPYGEEVSWARNVLAAGGAHLVVDGERRRVTSPEVVDISSTPLARTDALAIALFGMRSALRVTDADTDAED